MEKYIQTVRNATYWTWAWWGLVCLVGLVILGTFQSYGVTSDAASHVKYGRDIAAWYTSLFTDQSVFQSVNTWLYGGFFDLTVYMLNWVSPFDIHDTRHLYSAFIGLFGVVAAYRIGCVLGGPRAGFLAALCLVLTPRYFGHMFNNTKDIPFAVFYLWGIYYLIVCLESFPKVVRADWIKLGVFVGLTMAIRANGAVLFFYAGLFGAIRLIQQSGGISDLFSKRVLSLYVGLFAVAYCVLLPFWPWLQLHPMTGLWDGIVTFASFSEVHFSFFEGQYVASDIIPWYYAPKWLLLTLPEFVLGALMFAAAWFVFLWQQAERDDVQVLQWAVIWFGGLFPLVYGILSATPLYDGLRQMLFVIPPLVVVGIVGFERCLSQLSRVSMRWVGWGLKASLVVLTMWDMVDLHPNQYVYFNRAFAGGIQKAASDYETDYWNHTFKQGLEWLEDHANEFVDPGVKPTVGSLYPNLGAMVDSNRFVLTEPELADFYLGNTRYDLHRSIPGKIIHTIDAKGVPLLYVIQPDPDDFLDPFFDVSPVMHNRRGDRLRRQGDLNGALGAFSLTLDRLGDGFKIVGLDSSGVFHKMGNVLLGMDQFDQAMTIFECIPNADLYEGSIANNIGLHFIEKKDYKQALYWLNKAVAVAPDFYEANVSLGALHEELGNKKQAAVLFEKIAASHAKNSERQFFIGRLLYGLAQYEAAGVCFERVTHLKYNDAEGYYFLGLTKFALSDYQAACDILLKAVTIDPTHGSAYQSLAAAYMYLQDYDAAVDAYKKSITLIPDDGYLYTTLGIAQMNLGHLSEAESALSRALEIDPTDANARRHLLILQQVVAE